MPTTLTIAAVDQTARISWGSMACKLNTLDFTLVDPATMPVIGDVVALTSPTWAGLVVSVETSDPVDRAGHVLARIAATNQVDAAASAAPFGLSDAPDNTTTYGYRGLKVQTSLNQDGTTTIHGSCTVQQAGLWPAMTFQLTSANQGMAAPGYGFSVTNTTVTWPTPAVPSYQIEFGDPIVTIAVWAASQAGNAPAGSIDGTRITLGSVDTPQLHANAVTSGIINAGAVTADKLAATLLLASLLRTAAPDGGDPGTGLRMEIDRLGLRAYDASNVLQVNVPTDGSPVYVKGQVTATTLTAAESALLQGAVSLAIGSTTTVQNFVADPNQPPVLVGSVPRLALPAAPAHPNAGLCYDPAGDAGGATPTFWIGATADDGSTTDVAYEVSAATGAVLRTLRKTGSTTTQTATLGSTSHVADTARGDVGATSSQFGTPLTMPRAGTITKVAVWLAGRLGSVQVKNAIWSSSGATLLRETAVYTAASGGATTLGASSKYDKGLTSGYAMASGTTFLAGFLRTGTSDGSQFDRDDGSGKTTKIGDGNDGAMTSVATDSASKPNVYVTYTYTVDTSLEGTMARIVGVARASAFVWALDANGVLFKYNQGDLSYVGKTDLSASITGTKANAGLFYNGSFLIVACATGTTGTDQVKFVQVNPTTGAATGTTFTTTGNAISGSTAVIRGGCAVADPLNAGHLTWWVAVNGVVYGYDTTAAYAAPANRFFGTTAETQGGVAHDGTSFRGYTPASASSLWQFTAWDWSTATLPFWLAYSWYDDVGTLHESRVGPRASISLGRRRQLGVTVPAVPTGGADDPDKLNLYMLASATDPGAGSGTMKLQASTTATQLALTSYNAAGAADAASNNFPGGTPAVVQSQVQSPGWWLKGNGSTSFPRYVHLATPVVGFSRTAIGAAVTNANTGDMDADASDIPANAVGVSIRGYITVATTASASNKFFVYNYGGAANAQVVECDNPGTSPVSYTAAFVKLGGTNNREITYSVGWGAGSVSVYVYIVGYWIQAA